MPRADSARIRRATRTISLPLLACALGGVAALAQESHPSLAEQFVGWFTSDPAPVFTHPGVISLLSNLPFPRENSEDSVEITEDRLRLAPKVTERGSAVGDLRDLFAPRAEAITPSLPQKANTAVPPAPDPPSAVETPSRSDRADVATGSVPSPASRAGNDRREADANNHGQRIGSGRAVWYQLPGRTASGEKYNPDGMTAAHRALPLGMRVWVVNTKNGRSVVVRINDRINERTQAKANYVIDLSRGSARALGIEGVGSVVGPVTTKLCVLAV